MKSQFDPDVWAALFMIMVIGFGGITFMSMFVNGLTMHGLLQIFDQEYNQRCKYFLLPITSNDYALTSDIKLGNDYALTNEVDSKDFKRVVSYYSVNPPQRETYFDVFMTAVNKTIKNGYDLGENQTVRDVCWALGSQKYVDKKMDACLKASSSKRIIMSCSSTVYSPAELGEAEVVFLG